MDDTSADLEEGAQRIAVRNKADSQGRTRKRASFVPWANPETTIDATGDSTLDGKVVERANSEASGIAFRGDVARGQVAEAVVRDSSSGINGCLGAGSGCRNRGEGKEKKNRFEARYAEHRWSITADRRSPRSTFEAVRMNFDA